MGTLNYLSVDRSISTSVESLIIQNIEITYTNTVVYFHSAVAVVNDVDSIWHQSIPVSIVCCLPGVIFYLDKQCQVAA